MLWDFKVVVMTVCTCCDIVRGNSLLQLCDGLPLLFTAQRQLGLIGLLGRLIRLYTLEGEDPTQ